MESQEIKKQMKIGKIQVHRDLCIGAASCVAIMPGVFELDPENKAVILKNDGTADSGPVSYGILRDAGADTEMILLAAKSCPTQAIVLFDEDGNQIFPEVK
ncbi:MAG: ferredoxin [Patescibacteria group bacterium]